MAKVIYRLLYSQLFIRNRIGKPDLRNLGGFQTTVRQLEASCYFCKALLLLIKHIATHHHNGLSNVVLP